MRQSFIKTAAIAVFAALCGAVFSMSALAQTPTGNLSLINTNNGLYALNSEYQISWRASGGYTPSGGAQYNLEWEVAPANMTFVDSEVAGVTQAFAFFGTYTVSQIINNDATNQFFRARLVVLDNASNVRATFFSTPVSLNQPTSGEITISFSDNVQTALGDSLTAAIETAFTDDNGTGRLASYQWERQADDSADFNAITENGTGANYAFQAADFFGLVGEQERVFRVLATYQDAIGYQQVFTATATVNVNLATPTPPQGVVTFEHQQGGFSPYTGAQVYAGLLSITSGESGSNTVYQVQAAPDTTPGNFVDTYVGNNTFVNAAINNPANIYIRMRAIYTDNLGFETTFYSSVVLIAQPTEGLEIDFDDVTVTVAATLTANISGVTDANNNPGNTGGSFVSYTWSRTANDSVTEFVSLTSGTGNPANYIIKDSDFLNLVDGEKPVYQLVGSYMDALNYVQNVTALATVDVQTTVPDSLTSCNDAGQTFVSGSCVACTGETVLNANACVTCTVKASATPVYDSAATGFCRARVATDCEGETPEFNSVTKECRARTAADCEGATPEFNSSTKECRARIATDCEGTTPEFNSVTKECRARVATDCEGATPEFNSDTKECRERTAADCEGATPEFNSSTKECRARQQSDCTGTSLPVLDATSNACRATRLTDCSSNAILSGGVCTECVAPNPVRNGAVCQAAPVTEADCTRNDEIFVNNACVSCAANNSATPVFDEAATNNCRARTMADCTAAGMPVLDATSNECRARVMTDCTVAGMPVLDATSNECRARRQSDCTGTSLPVLDATSNECRAERAGDCTTAGMTFFDTTDNECRARVPADCTGGTPVLGDDNECRARQASDCTGAMPVLDNNSCRATEAGDCTGETPVLDNNACRARNAADCSTTETLEDGSCRATVEGDCSATETFANGSCRATVEGDCSATEIFENSSCVAASEASCNRNRQMFAAGSCVACTGDTPNLSGNECVAETVATCNAKGEMFAAGSCVACTGATPELSDNECVAPAPKKSKNKNTILYVGGGVVALLALYGFYETGGFDANAFTFSPAYNYSFSESGYAYNAGGRVDYQRDNLRLFWTATQENKDGVLGDLRYSSGAEYESDIWAAAFSESIAGKVADYNVSFSAAIPGDDWKISSVYRLHSRFEEDDTTGWESDSENSLSLEGVLTYRGWELKPTAGFQWQNESDFAKTAKFGLNAAFNYKQWHITPAAAYQTNDNNTKLNLQITRRF